MWDKREKILVIFTVFLLLSNSCFILVNGNESSDEYKISSEKSESIDRDFIFENPISLYSYSQMIYDNDLILLFDTSTLKVLNVSNPENHELLYTFQFQFSDFYYQGNDHWYILSNEILLNVNYGEDYNSNEYLLIINFYEIKNSEFNLIHSNEFTILNYDYLYPSCYYLDDQVILMADNETYNEPTSEYVHESYLLTYDLSDPSNVILTDEFSFASLDYHYNSFEIKNEYIFMNCFEKLDIRNFSDPGFALLNSIVYEDEDGRELNVHNNEIIEVRNIQSGYQTVHKNEYSFYDISDINSPTELYTLNFPDYWIEEAIQGDSAFCLNGDTLRIYDISDKENPTIRSEFEVKKQGIGSFDDLILTENYLYMTRTCEYKEFMFYIIDLSDLNEPIKLFPFGTSLSSIQKDKIFAAIIISLYVIVPVLFLAATGFLIFKLVQRSKRKTKLKEAEINSNEN